MRPLGLSCTVPLCSGHISCAGQHVRAAKKRWLWARHRRPPMVTATLLPAAARAVGRRELLRLLRPDLPAASSNAVAPAGERHAAEPGETAEEDEGDHRRQRVQGAHRIPAAPVAPSIERLEFRVQKDAEAERAAAVQTGEEATHD